MVTHLYTCTVMCGMHIYTPYYYCSGLIERPMNMTVDNGQQVTFICTYRSSEPPQNIININFNLPPVNGSVSIRSIDEFTRQGTLSFLATSDVSPAVSRGYECIVSVGGVTLITSEPATLTISCKFITTITLLITNRPLKRYHRVGNFW